MIDPRGDKVDKLEQKIVQGLVARDLIDEIPKPMSDEEDSEFGLIEVQGEALSDMIIRERR